MLTRRIGGHVSSAGGILNAIKNTQSIGGNCLQIFAGSPRSWARSVYSQSLADSFNQTVQKLDLLPVFIHALYLTNLASNDEQLRQKTKTALKTDLINSSLINAAGVVLHIGSHQGRGFESVKEIVADGIYEVLAETPINSMLLLENAAGQQGKIGSFDELSFLLKSVGSDRLGVCIDTAHAFAAGYDLRRTEATEVFVSELDQTVGLNKVALIHLNDSKIDLGKRNDQHENLGAGYIGLSGLKSVVTHPRLAHLPLILEVPGLDGNGPDADNIQIAQSLCV